MRSPIFALLALGFMTHSGDLLAEDDPLPPTFTDLEYGSHERQRFDIWIAESDTPTPLAVHIHGGGFVQGRYGRIDRDGIQELLDAGISVASIGYRFIRQEKLPAAHEDAVYAVQFLRHHAAKWNLDPERFGAFGGSAGAQLCLYLAFHDDFADPTADDPVQHQSSRLLAATVSGAQTTMDFDWWRAHIPEYDNPYHDIHEYFDTSDPERLAETIRNISALHLVSADDVPVYLRYGMPPDEPISSIDPKRVRSWQIHHVIFGVALQERMDELGVEMILDYPGAPENAYASRNDFLIRKLTGE